MVLDDFTPSKTRTNKERHIRTTKYLLEFSICGNTKTTTTNLTKLKSWLTGLLNIDSREFETALESLKKSKRIRIVGDMIITDFKK